MSEMTASRFFKMPKQGFVFNPSTKIKRNTFCGLQNIFSSVSVRFATAFVLIFGISVTILVLTVWEQTSITLTTEFKAAVRSDAVILAARYGDSGLLAVVNTVQRLSQQTDRRHGLYLLVDQSGNIVAGNLLQWPSFGTKPQVWYHSSVIQSGRIIDAIFRVYALPGGFRLLIGQNTHRGSQVLRMLRTDLLSVAVEVILLALVGGLMVRTFFRRALADLSGVAAAVNRGDLNARIRRNPRGGELDRIAGTVNEILDRAASLLDGVQNVTSAISHDLRSPITRVRMRLEEAMVVAADQPSTVEALSVAAGDLDRVTAIFNALLRIAEIDSGARRSAFHVFDLIPRLETVLDLYQTCAEDQGISLTIEAMEHLEMFGDPDMIQQAIVNLLDNALKFSPNTGNIHVTTMVDSGFVIIAVSDDGPGIPENQRQRIGERFFRTEAARTTPGSGLGLSLVVSVCRLHGGAFLLEDRQPGLKAILRLRMGGDIILSQN
ncbi:sensor histidine kinase [Acidiphilium sp.]|uniref:sensor histidine kinase n=1 Tax=Acidiphilium sp. TaxID=527 RepID=UPI003CFF4516